MNIRGNIPIEFFLNIRGNISVDFNESPLLSLAFKEDIVIDVLDLSFFNLVETDETLSFWDLIKDARDFAKILKENKMTVILNIKGKETLILGEKAKPSISQILSKSKDIEIKNIIQTAKMSKEVLD
ncbi:MAG: hypothetical protein M3M88_01130 [Thermoproteota archaeon]|nr:hypothetical protein [Thermoproteota archaeon]